MNTRFGLLALAVWVAVLCHTAGAQEEVCQATVDMAIVVDGSGSICDNDPTRTEGNGQVNCNNWSLVRNFIRDIVNAVVIGPDAVRMGLVTFANKGILEWGMDSFLNKPDLLDAVNNLPYPGGNTNTSGGLKVMRTELFNTPADRSNVQNVAIVITDGKSTFDPEQTLPQAQGAQDDGVSMFSVGVTASIDEAELRGLSSDPRTLDETYFMSTDFEGLQQVLSRLLKVTCVTPAPPTACGELAIDLTFVVDGSGSICDTSPECIPNGCSGGCENWNRVKDFMVSTVSKLTVGQTFTKIALVTFANSAKVEFYLNSFTSRADILAALASVPYPGGNTNTSGGLRAMHQEVYLPANGDRPAITDVALVITDGKSTTDSTLTIPEAVAARNKGISIYSVGVTNFIDENELRLMSSPPQVLDQNYFTSPDFDGLAAVLDRLLDVACETPAPVVGCINAADLVILVDSSGSIRLDNFMRVKSWMESFVNELAVDTGLTNVGLVTFGDTEVLRWNLDAFSTRADLITAIQELPYSHGTTNTGSALRYVVDNMFDGFDGDRPGVPNIALVLTDGGSNDKKRTWDEALRAKTSGMHILTVGIGDWIDRYELRAISSHPYLKNLMEVANYDDLDTISESLKDKVCNNHFECESDPCRNGGTCVDGIDSYYCVCPYPYGGVNCIYRCANPADVVFALDASGSITRQKFQFVVDFTKAVIMELPVDTDSRIGLVTYGDQETIYFNLKDYNERRMLMEALTIPFFSGGTTNTAGVLRALREQMFLDFQGDNSNAPNIGVVLTDGYSNDMTATWEQAMIDRNTAGMHLIAIGVGDNIREFELDGIASWPTGSNAYMVNNFDNLPSIVTNIRDAVCNANNECNSSPCRNGGVCNDIIQGYYCSCPIGFSGINCERNCDGSIDLAIVLDRSGSIRWERFGEVKQFIVNVIGQLEPWQDRLRVALVSFHDDALLHFGLTTYTHVQDIAHAILSVEFGGGRTNIASALDIVRNQVFRSDQGDRLNSPNLVLLFTDGSSNIREDETLPTSVNLKIDGARVVTVAVGLDLDMAELRGISSRPSNDNLMTVESITILSTILSSVVDATCNDENECGSNPCRNGGQCIDEYKMYRCECPAQFTGINCDRTCRRQYDVAFLLDISGSVDTAAQISMALLEQLVYGFEFSRDQVRASLITFADVAELHFRLDEYQDRRDYLTALVYRRSGGRTNTQDALRMARDDVFQDFRGDRNGVANMVILMTDGGSNVSPNLTPSRAASLKNDGVAIHVVTIGNQVDLGEVFQIASGTSEPFVYQINGMFDVADTADSLLNAVCQ